MIMIDSYEFRRIVIDGKEYIEDVIIWPDHVDCPWWRLEGHNLALEDISEVIKAKPKILIVGTGTSGLMKVPGKVKNSIEAQGIKVIIKQTKKACQIYNKLSVTKKVIACLHLTC